ncbi:response regulator transcription factor [candidate division KSB1 bacterium]|nr:response regulator transcription factor [candidate division KSB1 bacterium]
MEKIRVLLIEDNRLLREGIAAMLEREPDFEVVARSEDGDAIQELRSKNKNPDVVLLDLGLQKQNSLLLMGLIKKEFPATKVIAMDILPEDVDVVEFVKAGGAGFLLKQASMDDFLNTIRKVARGEKVLPPILTSSLFSQIIDYATSEAKSQFQESISLTRREREIVNLISEGLSNKEIAQRLHLATYTVKSHVHNILEKLALNTRLQVAAFAHTQKTRDTNTDNTPPNDE